MEVAPLVEGGSDGVPAMEGLGVAPGAEAGVAAVGGAGGEATGEEDGGVAVVGAWAGEAEEGAGETGAGVGTGEALGAGIGAALGAGIGAAPGAWAKAVMARNPMARARIWKRKEAITTPEKSERERER